jgi:hypothetical protein
MFLPWYVAQECIGAMSLALKKVVLFPHTEDGWFGVQG